MKKIIFTLALFFCASPALADPTDPAPRSDPSVLRARRAAASWLQQLDAHERQRGSRSLESLALKHVSIPDLGDRSLVDATRVGEDDRARILAAIERRFARELARPRSDASPRCTMSPAWTARLDDREGVWVSFECRLGAKLHQIDLDMVERGKSWFVADIEIDGALLSRNLRGQINKQLRAGGVPRVIQRLEAESES